MSAADRVNEIRAGDRRAIAALIRDLDDDRPGAREALRALRAEGQDAPAQPGCAAPVVIGVTGAAGAGKSTLVDALVSHARSHDQRVGVVAVDPSSPFEGGAVLGDRIRMQRHATDEGVFIRSVATRGAPGGISRSAMDVVAVLVAGGFSRVLLETVGAGQGEVDVAAAADVTLVVMTPALGDDVQMLKAGLLEIADVLVLNKSDLPGADIAARELQAMLSLRLAGSGGPAEGAASTLAVGSARVQIIKTVATTGQGIVDLVAAIDVLASGSPNLGAERRRRRAEARIRAIATARAEADARQALGPGGAAAFLVDDVVAARLDAEAAARVLMARLREGY
jgi:LAO/AO transport system kinase